MKVENIWSILPLQLVITFTCCLILLTYTNWFWDERGFLFHPCPPQLDSRREDTLKGLWVQTGTGTSATSYIMGKTDGKMSLIYFLSNHSRIDKEKQKQSLKTPSPHLPFLPGWTSLLIFALSCPQAVQQDGEWPSVHHTLPLLPPHGRTPYTLPLFWEAILQVLPRSCTSAGSPQGHTLLWASTCSSVGSSMGCGWISAPLLLCIFSPLLKFIIQEFCPCHVRVHLGADWCELHWTWEENGIFSQKSAL